MLRLQNLHKTFGKGTVNENYLYKGISLEIESGDFITIIGSNGAGKSTLLNIIGGKIPLDEGIISIKDKNISDMPEYKRCKFIGRVFQDPSLGTSPSMTILENLSMAYNKGKKFNLTLGVQKGKIDYFKGLLSKLNLGLEAKLHTKVGDLSGGQRQSLALLMATMSNPDVLLLDEHTAALDPKTSEIILDLTEEIIKEKNMTSLMVTHNLNHAIKAGNRLIMLHRGNIIMDIKGEEKKNLTIEKLIDSFEKLNFKNELSDRAIFS
ncbi:ABC transporter ATP-binding protein [Clostridium cylindrosporum]|uniref:ABC transporter ATP-binding protein n=1 Tax=Clostridium cylindrosporum TaxID=1495 RepID=UPI00065C849C|nr:ATP-binding cassette domain-containing protein [Clostridium cylindrosporum]